MFLLTFRWENSLVVIHLQNLQKKQLYLTLVSRCNKKQKGHTFSRISFLYSSLCTAGLLIGIIGMVGSLKMNTTLEYSTRVVQEGDRRCKKSTLNDLAYLTPLRIPLMNPVEVSMQSSSSWAVGYTVKKVSGFSFPSRDVADQTLPGRGNN